LTAPLPQSWVFDHLTADLPTPNTINASQWDTHVDFSFGASNANQVTVTNSIFTGGWGEQVPLGSTYSANVQTGNRGTASDGGVAGTVLGPNTDPLYANSAVYGTVSTTANYALAPSSPVSGKGSSILSGAQLGG
jgi:hypothetical protein